MKIKIRKLKEEIIGMIIHYFPMNFKLVMLMLIIDLMILQQKY